MACSLILVFNNKFYTFNLVYYLEISYNTLYFLIQSIIQYDKFELLSFTQYTFLLLGLESFIIERLYIQYKSPSANAKI